MDRSISDFAKGVYSALRGSVMQHRGIRSAYMQMEQESDDEEQGGDIAHSLFYSVHQQDPGEESIPLTDSYAYSDRSQLMFEHEVSDDCNAHSGLRESDYEESLKPSAIYLEPSTAEAATMSDGVGLITHQRTSLSESLLPTASAIPKGITSTKTERKLRDPFFAVLYCLCLTVFVLSGVIVALSTNSHALERGARGTMFKTITDCASLIAAMVSIAFVSGAIWIYILRTFTKVIVWGTVIFVPCSLVGVFLWSLIESRRSDNLDGGLTALSCIPLVLALLHVKILHSGYQQINKTIVVLELACDVLRYNPGIIVVSLFLMVAFIIFTVIWMILFTRLWLMGHLPSDSSSAIVWIVNDNVYLLAMFYIFMYLWTSALLINMQRFTLSAIIAQWYFHRHEPTKTNAEMAWRVGLARAATTSLGTIALGSLVLSVVQGLQYLTQFIRKRFKMSWPLMTVISAFLSFLEAITSEINNYTIALAGITGEGFYSSARSSTKIFRRNLLSGLVGNVLTKMILYVGSLVIALSSGFGVYIFATHNLRSPYGLLIGLLGSIFPLYMSKFFSYIMTSIVDATFLCYAIDLDTGTIHMSAAHEVFSNLD
ncbi:plasma-membrane choline transporter-domain-containing protein [Dichotomocladium elegans]|nr:plasma-membrane choline transporter-domain-containing protein [Dichotomocladium elegans]